MKEEHEEFIDYLVENRVYGRKNKENLCKMFEREKDVTLSPYNMNKVIDAVNESDYKIRMRNSSGSVFIDNQTFDRYKKYKDQIPEESHDLFETAVSYGLNPKSVVAAINYWVNEDLTRGEAGSQTGVTAQTVRDTDRKISDRHPEKTKEALQKLNREEEAEVR